MIFSQTLVVTCTAWLPFTVFSTSFRVLHIVFSSVADGRARVQPEACDADMQKVMAFSCNTEKGKRMPCRIMVSQINQDGKKIKNARMTLKHNGVVIHKDLEINGKTGGSRRDPEGTPGPIKLQGHGNPLQFRNVWIVENK